jgi:hypothetical protein
VLRESTNYPNGYLPHPELTYPTLSTLSASLIQTPPPQVTPGQCRALRGHVSKYNKLQENTQRPDTGGEHSMYRKSTENIHSSQQGRNIDFLKNYVLVFLILLYYQLSPLLFHFFLLS